jgi:hypothetical protein
MSTENSDRDAAGRFVPGHAGGPGRPRRAVEADYLAALSEAVPMETWKRIVARAVEDAEQGNAKARAWLTAYLVGKPAGDRLLELAAREMAKYDPVEKKAEHLALLGQLDYSGGRLAKLLGDDR